MSYCQNCADLTAKLAAAQEEIARLWAALDSTVFKPSAVCGMDREHSEHYFKCADCQHKFVASNVRAFAAAPITRTKPGRSLT